MTDPLVLDAVTVSLNGRTLVPVIDATIDPGAVLTVMGPSGSGKSTLLAYIGGFLDPAFVAQGDVRIGAESLLRLPPERRGVGLLFQDDLLFPHLSIGENLAYGLTSTVKGREARRARVAKALDQAGLSGFENRDPATLSGGQRARASLMRALLAEPRALLLDEPFSKLDQALRADFRAFLFGYLKERRLPTILVTHDPADAQAAGGRVIDIGAQGQLERKST